MFRAIRRYSSQGAFNAQGKRIVTMIPGDGIGPEISVSVRKILEAEQVPIVWEEVQVFPILKDGKTTIPDDALKSINKNQVALKGTFMN
jgi:isocitrate dehydrogenase (NAD+)